MIHFSCQIEVLLLKMLKLSKIPGFFSKFLEFQVFPGKVATLKQNNQQTSQNEVSNCSIKSLNNPGISLCRETSLPPSKMSTGWCSHLVAMFKWKFSRLVKSCCSEFCNDDVNCLCFVCKNLFLSIF